MILDLVQLVPELSGAVLRAAEQAPEPEDVKAGWTAFGIFLALCLAVALLGWSLYRRLKNVQAAEDAGLYDRPSRTRRSSDSTDGSSD